MLACLNHYGQPLEGHIGSLSRYRHRHSEYRLGGRHRRQGGKTFACYPHVYPSLQPDGPLEQYYSTTYSEAAVA